MTEDLETKLQEFRVWALTVGRYSPSTVQRMVRRVNYFILNSEKIREFSSKTVRTNQDNASLVYENLPAEAWAR